MMRKTDAPEIGERNSSGGSFGGNSWMIPVAVLGVAAAFILKRRQKNPPIDRDSSVVNKIHWMYLDDVETEANGPQDLFFALCLSKVYGSPILIGETFGKKAPGLGYVHKMIDVSGTKIPGPFRGASRLGMNQGASQLSEEIVKWAHQSGDLRLCVGGKWTDVALAVKQDASIASKIKVYGIGSSNALKDMDSFNYLKSKRVWMTGPDVANPNGSDYLVWIRQASGGDGWMNRVMKPLALGRLAMYPNGNVSNGGWLGEARRNNVGQAGINTALRVADTWGIVAMFEGEEKANDFAYVRSLVERGAGLLK